MFSGPAVAKRILIENQQIAAIQKLKRENDIQRKKIEQAKSFEFSKDKRVLQHKKLEAEELKTLQEIENEAKQETSAQKHNLDERLAQELSVVKSCELRQIKLRQQLRENEPELRELERKLRQAYVAKELACQIAQKKADKLEEKIREQQANEAFYNKLRADDTIYDDSFQVADMKKKKEYREALQKQMLEKEIEAKIQYEDFIREKTLLDDIPKRIRDEEEKIALLKMEKLKKTQEEMQIFSKAREEWRQREAERIKEENERAEKYLYDQMVEKEKRTAQKQMQTDAKDRIISKLGQDIIAKQRMVEDREQFLRDIKEIEAPEQEKIEKQKELEKKSRNRLAMTTVLDQQVKEHEERLKKEKEADVRYREELMQRMMEEQKVEQMSEQKRRMRMLEIRRTTEAMMLERQQKRAEEIQKLWREKEYEQDKDVDRKQKIENERANLLKEHFENLVGYFPAGVLRPEDLKHLGKDAEKLLNESRVTTDG